MEFSRDWLAQYLELPEWSEVTERLTSVGLALEGEREHESDVVVDLEVTPNRPDCMNHSGVARELAVAADRPFSDPPVELMESATRTSEAVSVSIEDGEGCRRFVGRVVRGVKVGPSPEWLVGRLEAIGQRPINNVVDITNFVMWAYGQPLHAFDLAKIEGPEIRVRSASAGEKLTTLDEEERELSPRILVIADARRPMAIAGVMGGLESEVTEATVDVLIEAAHFDPRVIRRGARELDMHTDASHRFERGADPEAPWEASARAAALIAEVAGGEILSEGIDVRSDGFPAEMPEGTLDRRRLCSFTGVDIPAAECERILQGLGFSIESTGDDVWTVTIPSWRLYDMGAVDENGRVYEADLFEEVMRHFGFDAVPSDLPFITGPDAGSSEPHDHRERMRRHLIAYGLTEAITFAFHEREADESFPSPWKTGDPVPLANPLSELYTIMRRSVLPQLHTAAVFNRNRGRSSVRLFEIGRVFPGAEGPEIETVAVVAGGRLGSPWQRGADLDLFDLKGFLDGLADRFNVELSETAADLPGIVSGTGAELVVAERTVGWIGQLEEDDAPYALFAAEIETGVFAEGDRFATVVAPPRHPGVEADLTLTQPSSVPWSEIRAAIDAVEAPELLAFGLKDRYEGEGVPEGAVNTTIYFVYNLPDRSLTQDEVNARHAAITEELEKRFGLASG